MAEIIERTADALEHAHSMGIVHRDVKPANLLVDHAGKVYVSDFGLARMLSPAVHGGADPTLTGDLIGTLRYMSPEQALAKHGLVDHRTDIYSLGATLYELLTLRPAVVGEDKGEILKAIAWEEPTPLRKLDKSIPVELETITLKCLAKEPAERYATAGEVAEDLRRWLGDHAIKAKPPGLREKAAKWVRRHQTFTRMSFAILVLAVTGLAISTWLIWREKEAVRLAKIDVETERDRAIASEKRAMEAQADTQSFSVFLVDDFLAVARPEGVQGGLGVGVTVAQALKAAEANLEKRFAGRPLAEATARDAIGRTWGNLAKYEYAERHLRRALELREQTLGPDDSATLASCNSLGLLLTGMSRYAEAIALLELNLKKRQTTLGPDHPDTLESMHNLALAYGGDPGKFDLALPLHEKTLEKARVNLGLDNPHTLIAMQCLANLYLSAGKLDLALALFLENVERRNAILSFDHPHTLYSMNGLARTYQALGKIDLAIPLLEQTLATMQAKLGTDHHSTLNALSNLGEAYREAGRFNDAIPLLEQAFQIKKAKLGLDHSDTLAVMQRLANVYSDVGKFDLGLPLIIENVEKRKSNLGPDHPHTLFGMNGLAKTYQGLGKIDLAIPLFEQALPKLQAKLGPDNPNTLICVANLGIAYRDAGRLDDALTILQQTLQKRRDKLGSEHTATLSSMLDLASVYARLRRFDASMPLLRDCLKMREQRQLGDWRTFNTMSMLGRTLLGQKNYVEAEPLLLAGYEGMKQRHETISFQDKVRLSEANEWLVQLYEATGETTKAAEWRQKLSQTKSAKPAEASKD